MKTESTLLGQNMVTIGVIHSASKTLALRALLKWRDFCDNQIATTATFVMMIALILTLALSSGCQVLGDASPNTFNKRIAAGYISVTAIRSTTTTLLANNKITVPDARNVQTQADTAREALDIARSVHTTNAIAGQAKLDSTLVLIAATQTYLATLKH